MPHSETHSDTGVKDLVSVAQFSENKRDGQNGSVSKKTSVLLQKKKNL